jgi:peptide/nickel transport system permease protein
MKKWFKEMPLAVKLYVSVIAILVLAGMFAELVMPHPPNQTNLLHKVQAPFQSWEYVLGTDQLGRDILSRCIYGIRISIGMALFGLLIGGAVGVTLGLVSGYFGGWFDRMIMSAVDFQMAVPFTLIILMGLALLGTGIPTLMIFIGLANWESYAKLTRGIVLAVREQQFVEAARSYNAPNWRIIRKHIFPNIVPSLIVLLTLNFPSVLMLESALSFLGIGVQPPTATLGRMVGEGRNYLMTSWWVAMMPALIILMITFCVQFIGEWLRDRMDVRLGQ